MTALLSLASFAAGLALGLGLWQFDQRRTIAAERRRQSELAELRRHLALPPAQPLPDRLYYHGQILCRGQPTVIGAIWRCWN
jgi:hypothetical protein